MRITVEDLLGRAFRLADTPLPVSGEENVVDAEEAVETLADAQDELLDLVLEHAPDTMGVKGSLSVASGAVYTNLPDDFLGMTQLFLVDSGNTRVLLSEWRDGDQAGYTTTETVDCPNYQIKGRRLYWLPLPNAAKTLEIWYTRMLDPLEDYADEIDEMIPRVWTRYLVGYLARYILGKQESDTGPAERMVNAASERIITQALRRRSVHSASGRRQRETRAQKIARLPRNSYE
ncbi:MAG: hypothetical protein KAI66_11620 [Lentisphaeria bacterium]|nr:hypothetical protein [Lentisphaeria bacterium]